VIFSNTNPYVYFVQRDAYGCAMLLLLDNEEEMTSPNIPRLVNGFFQ
jgi:hypothetical protein